MFDITCKYLNNLSTKFTESDFKINCSYSLYFASSKLDNRSIETVLKRPNMDESDLAKLKKSFDSKVTESDLFFVNLLGTLSAFYFKPEVAQFNIEGLKEAVVLPLKWSTGTNRVWLVNTKLSSKKLFRGLNKISYAAS